MMQLRRIFLALLIFLLAPDLASSQEAAASILRWGEVRTSAAAIYQHLDSRFLDGGRSGLVGVPPGELGVEDFPLLAPLGQDLTTFFSSVEPVSGSEPVDPALLQAGELEADVAWNTRFIPFRIDVGALPRLEIGVQLPLYRGERLTRRFSLLGGNVGLNPDPVANALLLESVAPEAGALGRGALLPLEGSALGAEVQRRVEAHTGERLDLPELPLNGTEVVAGVTLAPAHLLTEWLPGDLEIEAHFALLSTFGSNATPPAGSGFGVRTLLTGSVTIPTGRRPTIGRAPQWNPPVGLSGASIGVVSDGFFGDRLWIHGGGQVGRYSQDDSELIVVELPIVEPAAISVFTGLTHVPGDEFELWAQPRIRLTPEISLGGGFRSLWWRGASGPSLPSSGSLHRVDLAVAYSTLPAREARGSGVPLEISIGYRTAVAGSSGVPAPRSAYFSLGFYPRYRAEAEAP